MGTYDVDRHPRVGVLIEGLRAAGDEVVEADVPLPLDTAARVRMLHEPWRVPLLAVLLVRCWWRVARLARRAAAVAPPDAVLVGYLGHFDVHLARLLFLFRQDGDVLRVNHQTVGGEAALRWQPIGLCGHKLSLYSME